MFCFKLVCGIRTALVSTVITRYKGTVKPSGVPPGKPMGVPTGKPTGVPTGKPKGTGTATDPVQQLFLDKLREYRSKSPDGSFLEPDQSILKELKSEMTKLDKNYGGGKGVDMTVFPAFKFQEPKLDPIDEPGPETKKKKKPKKFVKKKVVKKAAPDWIVSKKKKKK